MGLPVINKEKTYKKMTLLSGLEVKVRPWNIGDKKDFLIQMELASPTDKLEVKKIMLTLVENCLEDSRGIDKMTNNDVLQVLAELKRHAEGDVIDFSVNCPHCDVKNEGISLSISKDVKSKPFDASPIEVNDKLSVVVRDLPEKERIKLEEKYSDSIVKFSFYFLVKSIVSVIDGDEIYSNFTEQEMEQWLDSIDEFETFEKITSALKEKRSSFTISKIVDCTSCGKKINVYFDEPQRFFVL